MKAAAAKASAVKLASMLARCSFRRMERSRNLVIPSLTAAGDHLAGHAYELRAHLETGAARLIEVHVEAHDLVGHAEAQHAAPADEILRLSHGEGGHPLHAPQRFGHARSLGGT